MPVATTGMNALQLHHIRSAVTAVRNPEITAGRWAGVNSSASRGGARRSRTAFHRSGSRTNSRTPSAAAAGRRPHANTHRHDVAGAFGKTVPVINWFTYPASTMNTGAEVY